MRPRHFACLFVGVLLIHLSVLPRVTRAADSQEKPHATGIQRERVGLVLINVVVMDRQGRSVNDLRPAEFMLRVDGHRVPIESVDVQIDADSYAADPEATRTIRRFILFFDALTGQWGLRPEALRSARSFLTQSLPVGDEAMVAGLGSKFKIYQGFTADPAKLLAALDAVAADPLLHPRGRDSVMRGGEG